jgi:hypothetical protein
LHIPRAASGEQSRAKDALRVERIVGALYRLQLFSAQSTPHP